MPRCGTHERTMARQAAPRSPPDRDRAPRSRPRQQSRWRRLAASGCSSGAARCALLGALVARHLGRSSRRARCPATTSSRPARSGRRSWSARATGPRSSRSARATASGCPSTDIPQVMKDAMVAVEDRRFHIAPRGRSARAWRARSMSRCASDQSVSRDLDHHPAARAQRVPQLQPHARPQAARGVLALALGGQVLQGADPRALPQQGLFRRRRLRHRFRQPQLLQPSRRASCQPGRGGDHRRAGQGAEPLFAHRRCRGRGRPRRGGARADARARRDQRRRSRRRSTSRRSSSSRRRRRTRRAISPTGRCRSSTCCCPTTAEPIEVWTTLDLGHAARRDRGDQGQRAARRAGRAGQHRPRRRGARAGRRHRLRATRTTTAPPRRCASRARRGSCSSISPRSRPATTPTTRGRRAGDDRRLEPAQFERAQFAGEIDLRTAFAYSINTVAAQLGNEVGFGTRRRDGAALRHHHRRSTPTPRWCSAPPKCGVIDMTRAFAAVSAKGASVEPYGIIKVDDARAARCSTRTSEPRPSSSCPTTSRPGSPTCCRPRSAPAPAARRRSAGR